jgi:hypothetical protein
MPGKQTNQGPGSTLICYKTSKADNIFYVELTNRFGSLCSLVEEETSTEELWEQSKAELAETCEKNSWKKDKRIQVLGFSRVIKESEENQP